mgnify:CR=1 FL=1
MSQMLLWILAGTSGMQSSKNFDEGIVRDCGGWFAISVVLGTTLVNLIYCIVELFQLSKAAKDAGSCNDFNKEETQGPEGLGYVEPSVYVANLDDEKEGDLGIDRNLGDLGRSKFNTKNEKKQKVSFANDKPSTVAKAEPTENENSN